MKKRLCHVLLGVTFFSLGPGTLRADEVLRRIQQSLRDQGFYYGPINGTAGDDTTQAVRRYQIRNGLPVNGQLDEQTKQAIEKTGDGAPPATASNPGRSDRSTTERADPTTNRAAPSPAYQRPTVRPVPDANRQDDARDDDEPAPAARPQGRDARPDSRTGPGRPLPPSGDDGEPPRGAVLPSARLSALFEGTPYEFAPPPVQGGILRRAQAMLTREGFYDGAVNGVPGGLTTEALTNFQGVNRLRKTGRLDVGTLGTMRLLPGRQALTPRDRAGDDDGGPRRGPNIIFEGRIAR